MIIPIFIEITLSILLYIYIYIYIYIFFFFFSRKEMKQELYPKRDKNIYRIVKLCFLMYRYRKIYIDTLKNELMKPIPKDHLYFLIASNMKH